MASRRSNLVACARPGRRGLGSGSQALGASTSSKTGRPWHHHHQKNQRRCVKVQARADPKSEAESSNPKSEEKSEEKTEDVGDPEEKEEYVGRPKSRDKEV